MKFRSALLASAFGVSLALVAGQASAFQIIGQGTGEFSNLSGCDNSGDNQNCDIFNSNRSVRWGTTDDDENFENPSRLDAETVNFNAGNPATFANNVAIARLDWFNSATLAGSQAPEGPATFSFDYEVTVNFSTPNSSDISETFDLGVTNTINSAGDTISGFTQADLNNLQAAMDAFFSAFGWSVSDLHWVVDDNGGNSDRAGCKGPNGDTAFNSATGSWFNCEKNDASLYLKADFSKDPITQVPEPATIALLGMGLLGLGAIRRRKVA